MGVKHKMKAWGKVGRSGRLRFIVEGKAKRNNTKDSSQQASPNSLEKGEDAITGETIKRGGKENKGGEDPVMTHWAKALAEAVGLQKAQSSEGGTRSLMRSMSWNVCGLQDEQTRGIIRWYL